MPELRRELLHERELPLAYLSLVRKLDRFIEDSEALRPRKDVAEDSEVDALRRQHDALMEEALQFFGGGGAPTQESDARRAFAMGLLRCTHYEETVLTDLDLVDTCGSKTLTHFEVDTLQGGAGRQQLREFLGSELGFEEPELDELEAALRPELSSLALRQRIMRALEERHPLSDEESREASTAALFDEVYPGNPFRPGEVQLIRTGTSLFFCIPFQDLRLDHPGWDERDDEERAEIEAFLRKWSKFKQRYYAHFPTFGFFRGQETSPELRSWLADVVEESEEVVADALTTMVSILQSGDVDKYIVHDAWGHQWQSLLFRFENTYRSVAGYGELPELDWRATEAQDSFADVIEAGLSSGAEEAVERWDAYVRSCLDFRLLRSLAGLVAEVLADCVEYKFILLEPERQKNLLSSSFFKDLPTKLDLTLWDIPWYFKMALKGFVRFAERDDVRESVRQRYLDDRSADADEVDEVIEALAERTGDLLDFDYRRSLHYGVEGDTLIVNAFCRVALNFLAMQSTFNAVYDDLRSRKGPSKAGVRRFHDPLVFATASFFELDWYEHFWLVDEFLNLHFPRLWEHLE